MTELPLVFDTVGQLGGTCLVLLVAQAVYVLFGFGSGLIAVGGLALILPEVKDVVVLQLLVNLPAELWVVATSRRAIRWRGVLLIMLGVGLGIPVGAWILERSQPTFLLTLLGGFLLVAGLAFLAVPSRRAVAFPAWSGPALGLLSGLLTGLFGTGGPPLILYYQLSGAAKAVFRGNLMAIFLLMTVFRVPSYAAVGLITSERLLSGLAVLPAVLLGAFIGHRIHLTIDEDTFRRLVSVALAVIGVVLLLQQLR